MIGKRAGLTCPNSQFSTTKSSYSNRCPITVVSAKKRFVIFSDMIQNSRALSFYHVNTSVSQDKLIALIKTKGLLPSFPNVDVYVYGTGGSVSEEKIRYIKQFWKSYFAATGSVLKAYSPTPAGY